MKQLAAIVSVLALTACGQAAAPAPQAPSSAIPAGSFDAFGADPAFDFFADVNTQAIELRIDDQTAASAPYSPPQATADGAQIISGDLTVDIVPADCTVNGADYPLRVTIQVRGQSPLGGCGIERWDAHLMELMPYVDACIAQSPQTRWVTYARADSDSVIVRMRGDNAAQDCIVPRDNAHGATSQPRSESLHVPGEDVAIFVRGPGEQPGGQCYEAPEIHSESGELLGWMADPLGC